jgi:hypothetical protein
MSLYILTLDEMKEALGIRDAQDDQALTIWMEGVQDRFDDYLQRKLLRSASETELHDGGERFLWLSRWPVESIASIDVDDEQVWDADSLLESDEFRANLARGKVSYGLDGTVPWPAGHQNIRVIYAGGFAACDGTVGTGQTAMPAWARRAMLLQSSEWRNRERWGVSQISGQGVSVQFGAGVALAMKGMTLLPEVEQTLLPHKRMLA